MWVEFVLFKGFHRAYVGGRAEPKPESVSLVLVDLAKRRPPEKSGVSGEAEVILEMNGLDRSEAEQLFRIVSENRGVELNRKYSWFTSQYKLRISGDKQGVIAAVQDIVEFCERTRKCRARIEKPF